MDWYKIIFFHLFNRYYRDGNFRNDVPWFTTSVILGASTYFYLLFIYDLGNCFLIGQNEPMSASYLNIMIICGYVFVSINCCYFKYQNRYFKIYNRFRTSDKNNKILAVLSWAYIIFGFFLVPITALLNHD